MFDPCRLNVILLSMQELGGSCVRVLDLRRLRGVLVSCSLGLR